ncbi:Phosphotransferase enzyme family protein [Geodermatophilus dictyosporus]|uniref:Phosphotransferase enzyme family protein n=1 Tax=Geodermatophilus dictyosporus TaxID=1523247 RepID=A0A1I5NIA6_9ACTN|nr:phosphotransferase [Geodermatophilus dictyosporus]SFP21548.1 Phosphotransferase enzyme family protein [Geodermatophilus dictyosporus]
MSTRAVRAAAAASAVAAAHGVRVRGPRVLHDGVNAVVHLAPAPVVARVATLTPLLRPDPTRPFGREVALAGALAAAGAAVVAPSDLVPPGPHRHDGLVLTFWRHVEVLPRAPGPAEVAAALTDLHAALRDLPTTGRPLDTPLDDLAAFVRHAGDWGVPEAVRARVAEDVERLRPRLDGGPGQALHGDAHPGNLLATPRGWCWTDLEDTCPGPVAWDLACLRSTSRLDGRAALDAVGGPSDAELAPWLELRRLHARAWTTVVQGGYTSGSAGSR